MPTIGKNSYMVVPMEKNKRFLMNDNEECIQKFWELAQDEQLDPQAR
jgi:hypothetical protein